MGKKKKRREKVVNRTSQGSTAKPEKDGFKREHSDGGGSGFVGKPGTRNRMLIACVVIVLIVTAAAFLPSLFNGYVHLDDSAYVMHNKDIQGFSPENIKNIFTSGYVGHYLPLTMLSYSLDHQFFKLDPFGYHLTNYILNLLITLLVFIFIYRISKNALIAFITALFSGINPLHVESVAWIAERKDVLCAFFYMITLVIYLGYQEKRGFGRYLICLIFMALALLSKSMAVTIPIIMIIIDYLKERKLFDKVTILEKVPFFAMAFAAGIVNIHFQSEVGAVRATAKGLDALYFLTKAIPFYLSKLIFPVNLSAYYVYHPVTGEHVTQIYGFIAITGVLFAAVLYSLRYSRKIVFGSAFFFFTVLPVLKIIPVGDIFAADRYMYISSIGIFYMIALLFGRILDRCGRNRAAKYTVFTVIAFITIIYSGLTWNRCKVWNNPIIFYEETLKTAPKSQVLNNNMGLMYEKAERYDDAISAYKRAIESCPQDPGVHCNIGKVYRHNKRFEEAIASYNEALKHKPGHLDAYYGLSAVYSDMGDINKELEINKKILKLYPDNAGVNYNIGLLYRRLKKNKEAIESYKRAVELDPGLAVAYNNLAITLYDEKRYDEAVKYCDLAVKRGYPVHPNLIKALKPYRE